MPENQINIRAILSEYGLHAKKNYGQNFLVDNRVLNKIVDAAEITKDDFIIEIGAGLGTLTRELCCRAGYVSAFEIDAELLPALNGVLSGFDNFEIINQDVMKADLAALINRHNAKSCKIVANLPYYITTPIIFNAFEQKMPIQSLTVMVQKEVGDRIRARAGTKEYGALTVAVRYYSDAYLAANVPRNCFVPRPDIDSAVIKLTPHQSPPVTVNDEKTFFTIIKAGFSKRRKTLINCLSSFDSYSEPHFAPSKEQAAEIITGCGFDINVRGETLTLDEFAALSNAYLKFVQDNSPSQ